MEGWRRGCNTCGSEKERRELASSSYFECFVLDGGGKKEFTVFFY